MTPTTRNAAEALFAAYGSRDPVRMTEFMADDMEWRVTGPVELMPFCGTWRGKRAILTLLGERVPQTYAERTIAYDSLLVDGDSAAALGRMVGIQIGTGRRISYAMAHFVHFRDGLAVSMRTLVDTFDAAEQLLGQSINLAIGLRSGIAEPDLVAV